MVIHEPQNIGLDVDDSSVFAQYGTVGYTSTFLAVGF